MKKKIKQFHYDCSDASSVAMKDSYIDGTIFSSYLPIIQLGIQTDPGVQFCLNGAPASDSIIVGSTGIYELDLGDDAIITGLRFLEDSFTTYLDKYGDLIVDIVYEVEDTEEEDD